MFNFIFQSSAWSLIGQSDFFTKLIVLSLFAASIICVAVIALKYTYLSREVNRLAALEARARGARKLTDFYDLRTEYANTLGGAFLAEGVDELNMLLSANPTEHDINRLDVALSQFTDSAVVEAESYLPVLGVSAAVSPLVGLFGTIWGLIHAFVSIGHEKSADLAVIAPGIAEALITTLVGLIVAIPAMIFFHYLSNMVRTVEHKMGHLSDRFYAVSVEALSTGVELGTIKSSRKSAATKL